MPRSCGNAWLALTHEQSPPCAESVPSSEDGVSDGEEDSAAGMDPHGRGMLVPAWHE